MDANKFASMLHRNTNRLTLVLVYVLLEWILIAMILVNSLFSYLIVKYADYFGLKRPCVLCSRIDHGRDKRIRKDMICEEHAGEISVLGFCLRHQKLVELRNMCQDCGSLEIAVEGIQAESMCSCCDVSFKRNELVSRIVIENRDLCNSDFTLKEDSGLEASEKDEANEDHCPDSEQSTGEERDEEMFMETVSNIDHLVAAELVQSGADEVKNEAQFVVADQDLAIVIESQSEEFIGVTEIVVPSKEIAQESDSRIVVKMETEDAKDSSEEGQMQNYDVVEVEDESDSALVVEMEVEELEDVKVAESSDVCEDAQTRANGGAVVESGSEIFVKMEIVEHEDANDAEDDQSDAAQIHTISGLEDDSDSKFCAKIEIENHEDATEEVINSSEEVSIHETLDDLVEDKASNVDKNELDLVERPVHPEHEDLVSTEKLIQVEHDDNLVLTDSQESGPKTSKVGIVLLHESADDFSIIEKLKAALEAETRALNEVCEELEQERNDAAEASTQTMAMITRLQEEKAALQLEASQYQRMMDEQSEFDQEALQLLNEIIVRREKENQELGKELELYRKRFAELESRKSKEHNNMAIITSESVSVTCSSFGDQDSDGISTEDEENHQHQQHHSVKTDDPLLDFEDERLAILNQLNELEQKLFELNEGELQHSRRLKPKKLLPLFDEVACTDYEDGLDDAGVPYEDSMANEFKRMRIEEEVEHVYERLTALQEDNKLLANCMNSLQKGDQGMRLVLEILQHLRALRRVEI